MLLGHEDTRRPQRSQRCRRSKPSRARVHARLLDWHLPSYRGISLRRVAAPGGPAGGFSAQEDDSTSMTIAIAGLDAATTALAGAVLGPEQLRAALAFDPLAVLTDSELDAVRRLPFSAADLAAARERGEF